MTQPNRKRSRRAMSLADAIEAIEQMRAQMLNPNLASSERQEYHVEATKGIKKLVGRLNSFQKQVDASFYRANPELLDDKPTLESTTLWDFPTQSYGTAKKGDSKFQGVTPAFIIYNMVSRYTQPGDLVLDPMCGSGTTIDVCAEEGREVVGMDVNPVRPDIQRNDARHIPLPENSVDMVFIDSPYGDNVKYSDEPADIGKISAEDDEFYNSLRQVASELYRVLKPGKVLGWLIGDQWVKRKFTPVGFNIYQMLTEDPDFRFIPVDLVCITRRNQSSNTGIWHYRAIRHNFYLRGFKHLIIVRKPEAGEMFSETVVNRPSWKRYK